MALQVEGVQEVWRSASAGVWAVGPSVEGQDHAELAPVGDCKSSSGVVDGCMYWFLGCGGASLGRLSGRSPFDMEARIAVPADDARGEGGMTRWAVTAQSAKFKANRNACKARYSCRCGVDTPQVCQCMVVWISHEEEERGMELVKSEGRAPEPILAAPTFSMI